MFRERSRALWLTSEDRGAMLMEGEAAAARLFVPGDNNALVKSCVNHTKN